MKDDYSDATINKLKKIPHMSIEEHERGWERHGKKLPPFKEYLWTADPGKKYYIYGQFTINGETQTRWLGSATAADVARSPKSFIDKGFDAITDDLGDYYEEEDIGEMEIELDYLWRGRKPESEIEAEKKGE